LFVASDGAGLFPGENVPAGTSSGESSARRLLEKWLYPRPLRQDSHGVAGGARSGSVGDGHPKPGGGRFCDGFHDGWR